MFAFVPVADNKDGKPWTHHLQQMVLFDGAIKEYAEGANPSLINLNQVCLKTQRIWPYMYTKYNASEFYIRQVKRRPSLRSYEQCFFGTETNKDNSVF